MKKIFLTALLAGVCTMPIFTALLYAEPISCGHIIINSFCSSTPPAEWGTTENPAQNTWTSCSQVTTFDPWSGLSQSCTSARILVKKSGPWSNIGDQPWVNGIRPKPNGFDCLEFYQCELDDTIPNNPICKNVVGFPKKIKANGYSKVICNEDF